MEMGAGASSQGVLLGGDTRYSVLTIINTLKVLTSCVFNTFIVF
jgi:hypothetical protein